MANVTALQPVTFAGNSIAYQRLFTFRTTDTQAVVEGANYFSKYDVPEAKVGDIIRLIGADYDIYYDITAVGDYLTISLEGDTGGGGGTTSPATDGVAGIVELATPAEAVAGTDTSRAVTPAGVAAAVGAIPTATYTVAGLVQLSSAADAAAGTSNNALTPATLSGLVKTSALATAINARHWMDYPASP